MLFCFNFINLSASANSDKLKLLSEIEKEEYIKIIKYKKLPDFNYKSLKIRKIADTLISKANISLDVSPKFWLVNDKKFRVPISYRSGIILFPENIFDQLKDFEISAILAHELAHIELDHCSILNFLNSIEQKKTNSIDKNLLISFKSQVEDSFDANKELSADARATVYMIKAGYNYDAILNTYKHLSKIYPDSLITPNLGWKKRLENIKNNIEDIKLYSETFIQSLPLLDSNSLPVIDEGISNFKALEEKYFQNSPEVLNNLAFLYYKKFYLTKEKKTTKDVISCVLPIKTFSAINHTRGNLKESKENLDKAIEYFTKIVEYNELFDSSNKKKLDFEYTFFDQNLLKKHLVIANNNLAISLLEKWRITKKDSLKFSAKEYLDFALSLDQKSPMTYNNIGVYYFYLNDKNKAKDYFKKALKFSKDFFYSKYNLNNVFSRS